MKMLDFNAVQQPTWPVKLKDQAQTVVTLSAPTVELVDRLIAVTPELKEVAAKKDGNTIRAVYQLFADLLSCNEDGFSFTAEELRDRYQMTLVDLVMLAGGYLEFVKEIQEIKN